MGTVNWNLTAQEEGIMRACLKATTALNGVGNAGDRAGRQSQTAFAKGAKELAGMATAFVGVGSAVGGVMLLVNQLKAEYQHLRNQQKRAAEAQMTVGEARATAILNKPAGVGTDWLDKLVTTTATAQKVDQQRLWNLAGQMLSSKGSLSDEAFASAFNQASRVGALTGEGVDLPTLGGGLQDVMRVTGLQDPKKAGGWIRQIGQQSRIVDLQSQIQAIVPAISSAKPYGWKEEQSAEFLAYLTMMSGDTEGRKSSTGTISFMEQIDKARTAGGAIIPQRGFGGKLGFRPLTKRGPEAIAELQEWYASADEGLREEFRGKLQGEKKIKGGLLGLISRDPQAMKAYAEIQANITDPNAKGVSGAWDSYFSEVGQGKTEPVREVKRIFDTFAEHQNLTNPQAGGGAIREGVEKALKSIPGIGDLAVKGAMAGWEVNSDFGRGDPASAGIRTIRGLQASKGYGMKYRTLIQSGWGAEQGFSNDGEYHTGGAFKSPNPNYDPAHAAALDDLIATLKDLAAKMPDATKPAPVEIVGDKRPQALRPGAQTEGPQ